MSPGARASLASIVMLSAHATTASSSEWVIDFGAIHHMSCFHCYTLLSGKDKVIYANGICLPLLVKAIFHVLRLFHFLLFFMFHHFHAIYFPSTILLDPLTVL
ncbi:hypothetical protein KSP39_PZI003902 [Platanthera zijinensis]|uniref:Uncharacterized protein n=1 Tax=Platanthera zijinensis TaxID=2320716 RepID=A0AAP0BXB6_9ASPA